MASNLKFCGYRLGMILAESFHDVEITNPYSAWGTVLLPYLVGDRVMLPVFPDAFLGHV